MGGGWPSTPPFCLWAPTVGCLDLSLPVIGGSSRGLGGDAVLVAVGVVMRMVVVRVVFRFYSGDNHPRGGGGGGVGSVCFLPVLVVAATMFRCSLVVAAPVGIGDVLSAASSALVSLCWTYSLFFSMEP
ncbi:hypothetical protein QL285_042892 [Trifolium repens]|nr:hypothetical protein QL285_042892 [Trifolium repens]